MNHPAYDELLWNNDLDEARDVASYRVDIDPRQDPCVVVTAVLRGGVKLRHPRDAETLATVRRWLGIPADEEVPRRVRWPVDARRGRPVAFAQYRAARQRAAQARERERHARQVLGVADVSGRDEEA